MKGVIVSVLLSVIVSFVCSHWANSDGRSALALSLVNLSLLAAAGRRAGATASTCLLLSALVFGLVELAADFLCVRSTRTLDYRVARSTMLLESPWWMPLAWAVVAIQIGALGNRAIVRFGVGNGALLTGGLGALLIPFYEEMAWGANWWRYRECLMIGHTPVYIIVAEFVIGAVLALWGYLVVRTVSVTRAVGLGVLAGLGTTVGGLIGWGLVEFIGRGASPFVP